jgi:ribonuclease P protein component
MTPPMDTGKGDTAEAPTAPSAVSLCPVLTTLQKRADFLRAASARRQGTAGFLLQARARNDESAAIRIGFTASKKIGNAVMRGSARPSPTRLGLRPRRPARGDRDPDLLKPPR